MKRVGVRYLEASGNIYAYDVSDGVAIGDLVIDEYDRVAKVVAFGTPYDGKVLPAQRLKSVMRAYRTLRGDE